MNFAMARGLVKSAHRAFELDGAVDEAADVEVFEEEAAP